jgi:hypothetical protein
LKQITFHLKTNIVKIELDKDKADWLIKILEENSIENPKNHSATIEESV